MESLGQRLLNLRKGKNLSREALGKRIGVSKTSIKNWEDDENVPKHEYLDKLAYAFNCSIDHLVEGKVDDPAMEIPSNIVAIGRPSEYPPVKVEYLDIKASCGGGYINDDFPAAHSGFLSVEFLRENDLPIDGKGVIVMHACNDSMGYTIPNASLMIVNTNDREFDNFVNKRIYVFNVDGEMICKRAIKNLDSTVLLKSDNADKETYPDQLVTRDTFGQFELFGRVHWVSIKV